MLRRAGAIIAAATAAMSLGLAWPARASTSSSVTPAAPGTTVPPAATPPTPIGTLDAAHPVLTFSGAVDNPTPVPLVDSPVQPVCAAGCREFTFTARAGSPFLAAIKNTVTGPGGTFNANDGFDLYLYDPSGALVGSGSGIGSNGQSLSVAKTVSGTYAIEVNFTYAEDANAAYAGEVRLMSAPAWQPAHPKCGMTIGATSGCFDLPRLQALPAYDLAVSGLPPVASTPLGFPLPADVPTSNSCYTDESIGLDNPSPAQIEHPIQRCLRFTSDVRNTGAGALEVRVPWLAASSGAGGASSGFVPGQCQAEQVITRSDGAAATRPAGACEFHPAHAHFHYKDLISFTLYRTGRDGGIGPAVATSLKESFCLADDDYFGFATAGPNGPREFVGQPGCNVPSQVNPPSNAAGTAGSGGAYVIEGVSPGWGDVYTWDTPDQYIDVTNVPAGTYDLIEETNPSGSLLVAGPAQTCALTQLQLTATSVTALASQGSISCPA